MNKKKRWSMLLTNMANPDVLNLSLCGLKNELHAATPAPFGASMPIGVKRKAPAFGHPPLNDNGWAACY